MRLIITNHDIGLWAAIYIREQIKNFNYQHKKKFVLGLPTGGTVVNMYKYIVNMHKNQLFSFKNVITFNMDEYIGLSETNPQSYHFFMQEHLFKHIDISPNNINFPNGNAKNLKQECLEYEAKILKAKGIDLFIGGVGENGHIAFNEQYSSLNSKTRDKQLDTSTVSANSRYFNNDIKQVPKSALTVGISTIMNSKEVLILISGEKKARALQQAMEGSVSHLWTITALQMHPKAIIVVDEAACIELKLRTYKYFKELEDEFSYIEDLCTQTKQDQ